MTKHRDFKALVRERMARTGERYSAARAQLLAKQTRSPHSHPAYDGVLRGYDSFGGIQAGTSALCNALRHAGIVSPLTNAPHAEAFVNGLCGGPGFLYAVFEYKGWPPILSLALQSRSMSDAYIGEGLDRLGVRVTRHETTSKAAARRALDGALEAGKAALCVVDAASLPWHGLPKEFIGGAPYVVSVAGQHDGSYWLDDRAAHALKVDGDLLAGARAAYRQAKNRLMTIDGGEPRADLRRTMADAIASTARRYTEPAVPKSFRVNCGFSGLTKWQRMLTDRQDKKGWPAVFAEGPRAYAGLQRAYEWIACTAAPGAGRAFYAEFLDVAASTLKRPALVSAASAYREAATGWSDLASLIANAPDKALRDACLAADRLLELRDARGPDALADSAEAWSRGQALGKECRLSREAALGLYRDMAAIVGRILEAEQAAVAAMQT